MTWAERLIRLASGDRQRPLQAALLELYRDSDSRAQRLATHAALAPAPTAESQLRALAAKEAAERDGLQRTLRQLGVEPPAPAAVANDGGHNHWARLVADLEACRTARDRLYRERARLIALAPQITELLDAHLVALDGQAAQLRELIARADPQALN